MSCFDNCQLTTTSSSSPPLLFPLLLQVCTKVDKNHFGPIPGIEPGMSWMFRIQVSEEGLHR